MARGGAGGSGDRVAAGRVLRARRGAGSALYAVLVIASVALVVAMSTRFRLMADLSRGAENTLSPQTMQALSSLDEDLELHALFTSKEPRRDAYFYLLMRYQTASAHVKVRFVDPVARPGVVKELEDRLGVRMNIPAEPQTVGALGAALIARERGPVK